MAIEYQKGNSTLHKLDPRTKLLLFAGMTVLSIAVIDPIIIAVMFLVLYLLGLAAVNPKELNANLRVLVVIFLTFGVFNIIFFTPSDPHVLFYVMPQSDWGPVSVESLIRAVAVFFRFFIVVLAVHLMLYTTPPADLVLGLTKHNKAHSPVRNGLVVLLITAIAFAVFSLSFDEEIQTLGLQPGIREAVVAGAAVVLSVVIFALANRGLPPEMGIALSIGFATVGILSQQTQKITDAQKARGYDVTPSNIFQRVRVMVALLIPIFIATLERSQDISVAILARAFDYNITQRTYRRMLSFHARDYLVMTVITGLLLGALVLNYLGIGNPTENFVLSRMFG